MGPDILTLAAVFASTALLAGMLASAALRQYAPARKRLRELTQHNRGRVMAPRLTLAQAPNTMAERICRVFPRSRQRMTEMRQRLVSAGYRSQSAPAIYAASQIVAAGCAGLFVLVAASHLSYVFFGMAAGFCLPSVWLSREISGRARVMLDGLADMLDLLIVCLESGSGLDQAILRCSDELGVAYKPLAEELGLVAAEIRAGTPRADALIHFADRTRLDDVRSVTTMLIQTDRYGTGIAQALRVEADLLRSRRRQRAEERAGKANVKLVIPLVLCLFPAFYILTLGPALLRVARTFMKVTAGIE
jgi:tight adherence protein C